MTSGPARPLGSAALRRKVRLVLMHRPDAMSWSRAVNRRPTDADTDPLACMMPLCNCAIHFTARPVRPSLSVLNSTSRFMRLPCLQCFDAVGWAAGRASGL